VFREILDWIVRLFTNAKISEILPNKHITLENMAYILKFENIKFQVDVWANGGFFSNRTQVIEEFSTKQSVDEYVNDLIAVDNIKREDIKVEHFPETEDTDEYWIVSYTTQ
jgi:hypothetical protein